MAPIYARFCPQCGTPLDEQTHACAACDIQVDERFYNPDTVQAQKMPIEETDEAHEATNALLASLNSQRSRRTLFKGAIAAASGAAVIGAAAFYAPGFTHAKSLQASAQAHVQAKQAQVLKAQSANKFRAMGDASDSIVSILTVARTAEQLAVTFYSNGIANASKLGITGDNLVYLKAALVEEQIHQQFFAANGGQSLATTFSFPKGAATFTDLTTFISTQQQLEGVFDSAFLAAIMEFAQLGRPDLAQIAGQVACIEAEHRALGRSIGNLSPADNWAFTPVLVTSVGAAPTLVQQAGYLSPTTGNSYTYQEVSTSGAGVEQTKPYSMSTGTVVGNG
jgi:ferritin-like protein